MKTKRNQDGKNMTKQIAKMNLFGIALFALAVAGFASAQSAEDLRLTVGKSVVIDYPSDVRQISTSNPEIIDASPVTTREILLHAKSLGNATMVVWSKSGDRTFYNVTVDLNLDPLRKILKDSFPSEQINPESTRDSISLNGKVSSKDIGDRAVALSSTFGKTIVNNLQLAAAPIEKQILLRVRFAELDRAREQQFGVSLFGTVGGGAGQTALGSSTGFTPPVNVTPGGNGGPVTFTIPQALNILAFNPAYNIATLIKALQSQNILQILAEPNLVTTNGKEAYFLVGGEFPVPILQGGANSGAVTVQFREFGIRLRFTPFITENKTIKLHVAQEVSTLDASNGVTISGFRVPALATRRAETDVELSEGQSFVIAGLLDNREQESFSKLPIIGSIPILGTLFKSKDEARNRTDLVVLVTPEVTAPLNPNDPKPEITFPRDFLVRLDDTDLFPGTSPKKSSNKKN
jgi:pilus assembly protein CpaC